MLAGSQELRQLLSYQRSHVAVAAQQKLLLQLLVLEVRVQLRMSLHHWRRPETRHLLRILQPLKVVREHHLLLLLLLLLLLMLLLLLLLLLSEAGT